MKEHYCGFRPKIAVDCDDTLFINTMVPDIIRENGLTITKHSWDMHELGEDVVQELYRRFLMPEYMCTLKPFPGNIEKMNQWNEEGYRICVVTARKQQIQKETLEMVRKYFPYVEDVYCSGDYKPEYVDSKGYHTHPRFALDAGKNSALVAENCHILIDDGGHNIEASLRLPWIRRFLVHNKETFYNEEFVARVQAESLPVTIVKSLAEVEL